MLKSSSRRTSSLSQGDTRDNRLTALVAAERVRDLSNLARRKMMESSHRSVIAATLLDVQRCRVREYESDHGCGMCATVQTELDGLIVSSQHCADTPTSIRAGQPARSKRECGRNDRS